MLSCCQHLPEGLEQGVAFEGSIRKAIVDAAAHLYQRGHNAPVDGNISVRLNSRYLLCTPSQEHKGRLKPSDVVKVRMKDGCAVDSSQRASSEVRMHFEIYRVRNDISAIVHAHSPFTVGLSVAGISMEDPAIPEVILALGHVPTVPYASPTTTDVPEAIREYARLHNAFVLERHGPVILGDTLEQAMSRLEIVEHTAKITWIAQTLGPVSPIDAAEHAKLVALAGALS